ncbi:MAG TPA: hypothetical protein VF510_15910, partial [Ktedonobacterales bacterium]
LHRITRTKITRRREHIRYGAARDTAAATPLSGRWCTQHARPAGGNHYWYHCHRDAKLIH